MAAIGERSDHDDEVHRASPNSSYPKDEYNEKGSEQYNEEHIEYNRDHDEEEHENSPIEEVAAIVPV